jgi:tRNA pseudouridine55 synthase
VSGGPVGLAVLDKPPGLTSHDVVAVVRRTLGERRVGHAGTLDPPATGVLLVGVGRATRLLRFLQGSDKSYDGTLALGVATTTLDATGVPTATFDMSRVADESVRAAAAALTGSLVQRAPMVSAVHVGGRRLHELAREGIEVERPSREVRVDRFDVAPLGGGVWRFDVTCSAGTYVRALVDDLGRALGGGAHVATLRRTRAGAFSLHDAVALDRFTADPRTARASLRDPVEMVAHLGVVDVSADDAVALARGQRVTSLVRGAPREVAVRDPDGRLVGVATRDEAGALRPSVVVAPGGPHGDE